MSPPYVGKLWYQFSIGLLSLIFGISVLLTVVDSAGTSDEFSRLGFPTWIVWPLTLAKALGIATILISRSTSLRDFAFAGFLFDLLLAVGAHLQNQEPWVLVSLLGLVLWIFAYIMERNHRHRHAVI